MTAVSSARAVHRGAAAGAARSLAPAIAVTFWVVLPIVCLLALGVGVHRLAGHAYATPAGTRGIYQVTSHNCQRQLCITGGTFTSADGRLVVRDLLGDYRWKLGTQHGAVYDADAADVIPLPAHWDPSPTVLGMAGGAVFLGVWGWCLGRALRRARSSVVEYPATR